MSERKDDLVHPKHYRDLQPEPIDVIEAWGLGFHLGNALKYLARAGHKNKDEYVLDLSKAQWYIARAITHHQKRSE